MRLAILICLLLASCSQNVPEAPKPSAETQVARSNPLPSLPPIVLERPQPSVVDTILQTANSHAEVSYTTNADGIECTFKSPDSQDRLRVQQVVTRMFGVCRGTIDPPTVAFKLSMPYPVQTASTVRAPAVSPDDINARVQQRWEYEKAKSAKEIHDLEVEIKSDEIGLAGTANRALAFGQAEIIKAKKSRLDDLRAYYVNKYHEDP